MNASSPKPLSTRRRIARFVLVALVAVGAVLFYRQMPRTVAISFDVPPTVRVGQRGVPREAFTGLSAAVYDDEKVEVARFSLRIGSPLEGPLTPPVAVRLRPGAYVLRAELTAAQGARAVWMKAVEVRSSGEDADMLRIGLD